VHNISAPLLCYLLSLECNKLYFGLQGIFRIYSRVYWIDEFKCVIWIFKGAKELPWQPNLGKNKPKLQLFQFCAKNRGIFRINSRLFRVDEFKYAIWIFRSARSCHCNQIYTKISQNCTNFISVQEIDNSFFTNSRVNGVGEFKYATWIFQEAHGVAMATKFGQK